MNKPFNKLDVNEQREFFLNPQVQAIQAERLADMAGRGYTAAPKLDKQRQEAETQMAQMIEAGQATGIEFRDFYKDFQAARRTLSEEVYGDRKQRKAKSPEEVIAFEYWDVELQNGPDGLPNWPTFFAERDAILQANADKVPVATMKSWLRNYEANLWLNDTVRAKVVEMLDAEDVMAAYCDIPRFTRLSVEDGELVQQALNEAQDMVSLGRAVNQKSAIRTIYKEGRLTKKEYGVAMNANRLGVRNRQRAIFWKEHADDLQMFCDIPAEFLSLMGAPPNGASYHTLS
jgi:hypothetical protein